MEDFQKKACEVYRQVAQLPIVTGGRFFRSGDGLYEVELKWSQRDVDRGVKLSYAKSYIVQRSAGEKEEGLKLLTSNNFQRDATSVCMESYSSCSSVKAVLMKGKTSKSEDGSEPQQFIEIWNSNRLVKSLNVKEQFGKKHGKINDDDQFASFQLSSDGTKLLYIAEKKVADSTSYFKKVTAADNEESKKERGTEYLYSQDWGERLTSVISPVVAVLDIESEDCTIVDCPDNVSCGRACWVPNTSNQLVFVGYDNYPLKLGFVFCFSRKSTLFFADLDKNESTALTDNTKYIYAPRFNPQATKLVFLENDTDLPYPHRACSRLRIVDWKTKAISTVVDIVSKPTDTGFTGIYAFNLPERCWDSDGKIIYYHDIQKSYFQIMSIDTTTGAVACLTSTGNQQGSYGVLDVFDGLLLGRYANPAHPMKIFIAKLPTNTFKETEFCDIAVNTVSVADKIKWEVIDLNREGGGLPYQAIFVTSTVASSPSPPPLIVYPHGGPHAGFAADFIPFNACLVSLGFCILMVNYNGSMGFGQDFVTGLSGKVGALDIQDVQHAANVVIDKGQADGNRVVVRGGSHGGFIAAHLIGQYPDKYKAAFLCNPVINLTTMTGLTDIPDWTHSITDLPYDPLDPPTVSHYSKMLSVSPIIHAQKVKAAVIVAIGGEDHRVPPSQGKEFYLLLNAQGKDARLFFYPKDSHPLWSVDTDADCFMNCALLFHKHTVSVS